MQVHGLQRGHIDDFMQIEHYYNLFQESTFFENLQARREKSLK